MPRKKNIITFKYKPILPQYHEQLKKYIWVETDDKGEPKLVTGTMEEWKKFLASELVKEVQKEVEEYSKQIL